jgi:hypothetical protein
MRSAVRYSIVAEVWNHTLPSNSSRPRGLLLDVEDDVVSGLADGSSAAGSDDAAFVAATPSGEGISPAQATNSMPTARMTTCRIRCSTLGERKVAAPGYVVAKLSSLSCRLAAWVRPYRVMGWGVGDPRHRWKVTPTPVSDCFSTRSFHLRLEDPRPKEQRSDRKPQGFVKTKMLGSSLLGRFGSEGLVHRPLQRQSLPSLPRGRRTRTEIGPRLAEVAVE